MTSTLPIPRVGGVGPLSARIAIVTENATADDIWKGYTLAGAAGDFFAKLLHEAGITRAECYISTVCKEKGVNPFVLYSQTKSDCAKYGLTEAINGTWVHPSLPPRITEEIIEQIFVPFFTTRENGSGIGLSLSRQIMRLHGGTLHARSIPGKETVFSMIF